jgi:ADP-heptose:LPS heptosyltransferase
LNILVRRIGALGDVVLVTPVVQRLHAAFPEAEITVQTCYPDVFLGNPCVAQRVGPDATIGVLQPLGDDPASLALYHEDGRVTGIDRFVDLDLAYEKRPGMHIVEAFMLEAFGEPGHPEGWQQTLHFPRERVFPATSSQKYVAVHAAKAGWVSRTLPSSTWLAVIDGLQRNGLCPILVGTEQDDIACSALRFLVPDIHGQARLIASCACYVGSDSGLLHVAGATDTPIVGVFTCVRPEYRLPWRHGVLGWQCEAVVPDLPCVGCQERAPIPTTIEVCERGAAVCATSVDAMAILAAVMRAVG